MVSLTDIQRIRIARKVAVADGFEDEAWDTRSDHSKNLYFTLVDAAIAEYEVVQNELRVTTN